MEEASTWNNFSDSSKTSLRWAAALARCRHAGESLDIPYDMVNVFDLFVGLLLAHPDSSEPKTMLDHFRLSLGQILPEGYQRPDAQALKRNLRAMADTVPPMEDEVLAILNMAESLHSKFSNSSVVEHRFIFAAMLMEKNNQFQKAMQAHIEQLGSKFSELSQTTMTYLSGEEKGQGFAELLMKRHPLKLRPLELPSYRADHGQKVSLVSDLVGIHAEVDAFAYLLGSKDLKPPLAIGLFGDWGSGKSFFMEAVESRIRELTEIAREQKLAQKDVPFWKHIVQIRFNAWHYVEGELWASLVEHIFSQLKVESKEDLNIVEQRRQYWTKEITGKREELEQLESRHRQKQQEQQECQKEVVALQKEREVELQNLESLKSRNIADQVLGNSLASVRQGLTPHFQAAGVSTFGDAIRSIQEAKSELQKGGALLRRCTEDNLTAFLCVAALLLVPLLIWCIAQLDLSPFVTFLGKLGAIIAPIVGLVHRTTGWVRKQRMGLQTIETEVRAEIESTRKQWNSQVQGAVKRISDLARDLDDNQRKQDDLRIQLAELEKQRNSITSVSMTNEFIAERTGSDDYRCLLGVPALIQRDFLMLSELVKQQNSDILEDPGLDNSPNVINRIILYIDDLDRCRDEHVIKVLQAVHLLLAFDLFVVVVAVDARWLNKALVEYYPALVDHDQNGDQPTADDYLEKIFQIPFWVEPLVDDAKRNIMGGLLRAQLTGGEQGGDDIVEPQDSQLKIEDVHLKILDSIMDRSQPLSLKASDLSVSKEELDFLGSLAPVLGDTPRAVKRFVNLYQLLRIIHQPKPEDEYTTPSDYQILALLLAIGDGLPRLASPLFLRLSKVTESATLSDVTKEFTGEQFDQEVDRLLCWLETRQEWSMLNCRRVGAHIALAERFLFRVGRDLEMQQDFVSSSFTF